MILKKTTFGLAVLMLVGFSVGAFAEEGEWSGAYYDWKGPEDMAEAIDTGAAGLDEIRRMGLEVFTGRFTREDGHGDGPFDLDEWLEDPVAFGHRATLQGNGQLLRINGLDAQSCNECHSIVSHRTNPPRLGIGGVGGMVQNAIIMPSMIDVADSGDDRVSYEPGHDPDLVLEADGAADFNGRFANPPFLFGGGGVELLAKEMTVDLQKLLEDARNSPAGTVIPLDTHEVHFGSLLALGGGDVDLSGVEGVGPKETAGIEPEEVLVVRPFGRKGDNFSMRDFDRGAMQFHFGIQPVEVVDPDEIGGVDEDGDGVSDEVGIVEMSALHVFDVTNPIPRILSLNNNAQIGFERFLEIGCASCHRPSLETRSRLLPLAHPEVPTDPGANVYLEIDLARVGFKPAPGGGVFVPLFADLKRHRMGAGLAESFERADLEQDEFTTARLWGVADTAPYLHDGRATTLAEAIELHGGEAQAARDAFLALSSADQGRLLKFLSRLRVPRRPNEELLR
jgi:cytochrome c peroxidase